MNILRTIFSMQATLFASLEEDLDALSEKEREFVRIVSLARMKRFTGRWAKGPMGRPRHSREAIARAFAAKALWNFPTTEVAVEYLKGNKNLRRLCGWEHAIDVPSLSTFARAFAEFAAGNLAGLVHEATIRGAYGEKLAGHVSRDATAIEVRQKPVKKEAAAQKKKHRRERPCSGKSPLRPTQHRRARELGLEGKKTSRRETRRGGWKVIVFVFGTLVEKKGFEPSTPALRTQCSPGLSYFPRYQSRAPDPAASRG